MTLTGFRIRKFPEDFWNGSEDFFVIGVLVL